MIATPVVGPHEHNGPITVVAMQKEVQTRRVHERKFGERERLAHEPSQPLPQRVIPTLHMSGFPSFLSHSCVLLFWKDGLIGPPKIGVAVSHCCSSDNEPPSLTCELPPLKGFMLVLYHIIRFLPTTPARTNNAGLMKMPSSSMPMSQRGNWRLSLGEGVGSPLGWL